MRGKPKTELVLSETEREQLTALTLRRKTAQALALRACIVLACTEGVDNKVVASRQRVTQQTVSKWRARFVEHRLDGLVDAPRPGAQRSIDDARVDAVIAKTLESVPEAATHWSTRTMARETGLSQTAASHIWRAFGLQPHRQETFKLSSDPLFVEKVRDIVGLYLARRPWPWSRAWTRRAKFRRWIASSPWSPWHLASPSAVPMTMSATARPRSSRRWTSPPAPSSRTCIAAIAAPSSCSSCAASRPTCQKCWTAAS